MHARLRFGWLLICSLLLAGPASASERAPALNFGLMPYLSTRALLATYQPLAQALEQRLKQPVQLVSAPDFDTFIRRVIDGDYDLVLLAPHYARLAAVDHDYVPLLVHKTPIRGIFVTARQQPLNSPGDLRDQSIAIVDRSALLAIVGAASLADDGLREGRDYRFVETVSHSSALQNAISGKARAALVSWSTLALAASETQQAAVIWRELAGIPGQYYIAHNRLTRERREAIRRALLDFADSPEGRSFFEKTQHGGFREPSREDSALLDRLLPETRRQLGLPGKR